MTNDIYKELTRRNISQQEFAYGIGMRPDYLNRIINNRVTPTIPTAYKIARGLNMTVAELWFEDDS